MCNCIAPIVWNMLEKFLTAVCQPIGLVVIWVFIPLKTIRVKTKDMMVGLDKIPRDFKAPVLSSWEKIPVQMTFLLFLKVFHAAIFYNQNKNFMQIAARRRQVKCGSVDLKMILLYVLVLCHSWPQRHFIWNFQCAFSQRDRQSYWIN